MIPPDATTTGQPAAPVKRPDNFIGLIVGEKNHVMISPHGGLPRSGPVLDPDLLREVRICAQQFSRFSGYRVILRVNGQREVYLKGNVVGPQTKS